MTTVQIFVVFAIPTIAVIVSIIVTATANLRWRIEQLSEMDSELSGDFGQRLRLQISFSKLECSALLLGSSRSPSSSGSKETSSSIVIVSARCI
jgi:hypothetical protein